MFNSFILSVSLSLSMSERRAASSLFSLPLFLFFFFFLEQKQRVEKSRLKSPRSSHGDLDSRNPRRINWRRRGGEEV